MTSLDKYKDFTILYVEDEKTIRFNVENCLNYIFNVITASNGKEGLEYFNENKIDLVITDINMPVKDGLTMLDEIREVNPNIPCIITSAYDFDLFDKITTAKFCQYVIKPFDIKELLQNSMSALKIV